MTREDILRELGWAEPVGVVSDLADRIERVVRLAEAAEREACAKVCDDIEMRSYALWKRIYDSDAQGRSIGASDCAEAIRERGQA